MKKLKILVSLLCMMILLSSCYSGVKTKTENFPLTINDKANVLALVNHKVLYFIAENSKKNQEIENERLFQYDLDSTKTVEMGSIQDVSTYSGSVAYSGENLYIPLATDNENILVHVDTNKNQTEIIKRWKAVPPLSFLYFFQNSLILFGPNAEDNTSTEYYINRIEPSKHQETNIVNTVVRNKKGNLISCLDVDTQYIYAFSIASDTQEQVYRILKYNINGKLCAAYPFDLNAYFNVKTLVGLDDSISNIYKENNFFILNTLNGRAFVFQLTDKGLKAVTIPEKYYKDNPSGYRFVDYTGSDSGFAYFYNTFGKDHSLTIFNCESGKISSFKIPVKGNISSCYRNVKGDLIVKTVDAQNANAYQYFSHDYLLENIAN